MTIYDRKRRSRRHAYILLAIALLLLAGAALVWFILPRQASPAPSADLQWTPTPSPVQPAPTATPGPTPTAQPSVLARNLYQGSLSLFDGQGSGQLSIHYVNTSPDTLYVLYLHLYPNAVQPDSLQIGQVTLSGVAAFHGVSADGTLLRVPLVNELLPGESVRLYLDFSFTLPRDGLPMPQQEEAATHLGCLVPVMALYENQWLQTAQPDQVNYAPVADWRLRIHTDESLTLLAGDLQPLEEDAYLYTHASALPALILP